MFDDTLEASLEAISNEIAIRKARENLIDYETLVNPGYKVTKFHKFLSDKIQSFMERDSGKSVDILLLSVPPQH